MKGRHVAYASLSAALALLFTIIGYYVNIFPVTMGTLAALALTVPYIKEMSLPGFLAYLAAAILAFAFISPVSALIFAVFFGAFPSLYYVYKKVNAKILKYALAGAYYVGLLVINYFVTGETLMPALMDASNGAFIILYFIGGMAMLALSGYVYAIAAEFLRKKLRALNV